jgi:hypothetical protein
MVIRGCYRYPSGRLSHPPEPPNNCHGCGTAYPWRIAAIANAIEVVQMQMRDVGRDPADAEALVKALAVDSPTSERDVLRFLNLWTGLPKVAYDLSIKVIADVASATAKRYLGLS